ncbi:MAG: class I tRNA ligase family protein, partial [Alphaproteobacteria bacterium]|nr:class I tRNA ligase family protein [Alphaproteobacteria bacterium]
MPDTQTLETSVQDFWDSNDFYKCNPQSDKDPFCIMIPPPNVTGVLHAGHALNNSLIDFVVRYQRMKGKDVLWQPGTDHAGIATQRQVEKNLEKQKIRKTDLGREAFIKKVWEWKEKSGGQIIKQLKRLGASCDWSRERFTMDKDLSDAVRKVFVKMYKDGLIYKGTRMVNWCPKQNTAVSDLEVENQQMNGKFWHIKYPLEDGSGYISIATTRPETTMGDGAVAVHPSDERYKHLIGKNCVLPLLGRLLPIIADEHPDPEKGSGAVKITGAHDFDDYEVAKRHNIPLIQIMDFQAKMNENVPEKYR